MERKMFDTPVLPRLATVLAEVKSGDLVVPKFQRPFVWNDDRRLSLLDSIVQGMPIGSLMVWRTNRRDLDTYKQVGGIQLPGVRKGDEKVNYLMDGHQRISTLFGALYSGVRESIPDDDTRWPLYYELSSKDRPAFRVPPNRGPVPEFWLPIDILLDGDKLFDFTQKLRQTDRRDLAKEAESLANIFRDYIIPIVPLVTEELDIVTDAFVRINSQGKGMTEAHMLRALTHLKTSDTDDHFRRVRSRLEPLGWASIDDQVLVNILKAMLGLDVYASSVRGVHERLQEDPTPLNALVGAVEEAVETLNTIGVCGPAMLPYVYQLVTLTVLAARFPGRLHEVPMLDRLRRWFWITTYTEHFTGITGNRIRDGIEELASDGVDKYGPSAFDHALVKPLREIRMSSVRARAFLLFMAQLPRDPQARLRRQDRLRTGESRTVLTLLPSAPSGLPGNRVIADSNELHKLRVAIQDNDSQLIEMADEFGIPDEALNLLPRTDVFLEARGAWLIKKETEFIESLGLLVGNN